jgi:hypothetical protein
MENNLTVSFLTSLKNQYLWGEITYPVGIYNIKGCMVTHKLKKPIERDGYFARIEAMDEIKKRLFKIVDAVRISYRPCCIETQNRSSFVSFTHAHAELPPPPMG